MMGTSVASIAYVAVAPRERTNAAPIVRSRRRRGRPAEPPSPVVKTAGKLTAAEGLATLDMQHGEAVIAADRERHVAKLAALPHARGCRCDRPLPDGDGGCGKCGRAVPRCQCVHPIDDGTGVCFRCGQVIDP